MLYDFQMYAIHVDSLIKFITGSHEIRQNMTVDLLAHIPTLAVSQFHQHDIT